MNALNYIKRFGEVWILVMDGTLALTEVIRFQDILENHGLNIKKDSTTSCFRIVDFEDETNVKRAKNKFNKLLNDFPVTMLCKVCFKQYGVKLKYCSVCKSTSYCSRECQVKDWKNHKMECKTMKELGEKFADTTKSVED